MDYMLMQLDDSFASSAAIKYLSLTDECSFELSFDEPRLWSILFGSRSNTTYE